MMANVNYEWRAFGKIDDNVRHAIETLEPKFETGISLTDEYILSDPKHVQKCTVNTKLRNGKLKFKQLKHKTSDRLEIYEVESKIPIDAHGIVKLEDMLETKAPKELKEEAKSALVSELDLKKALPKFKPPLLCIPVRKYRTQYLKSIGGHELLVEIADILEPVQTGSICIECKGVDSDKPDQSQLDAIRSVRDQLKLPGSMLVKSYLDVLQDWAGR